MAAFNAATHKVVVASSANPKDDTPIDARVMMARLFGDMGLMQITAGNTPPSNKDVLWWHIDVKALKRWDGVLGNWYPATPNQLAMHLIRRAVLGSQADTTVEAGDLFMFWDVSLGDLKVINRNDLMAALGSVRTLATEDGIQGGGHLGANRTLKLDINGLAALPTPALSDVLAFYSITNASHRKITFDELAQLLGISDYLHSEIYFMGMM